jgi:hypothetical protein
MPGVSRFSISLALGASSTCTQIDSLESLGHRAWKASSRRLIAWSVKGFWPTRPHEADRPSSHARNGILNRRLMARDLCKRASRFVSDEPPEIDLDLPLGIWCFLSNLRGGQPILSCGSTRESRLGTRGSRL